MSDEPGNGNPFNLPSFRKELGDLLDEKLAPINKLVAKHEAALQRGRGAMWAIGAIQATALALWEWFAHFGGKK